jgi:hypothetical protein
MWEICLHVSVQGGHLLVIRVSKLLRRESGLWVVLGALGKFLRSFVWYVWGQSALSSIALISNTGVALVPLLFAGDTNRRSWMNVRKSLGGNWCDGGSFHYEIKFRHHNWTSSCVGQTVHLGSVPPSVFIVCLLLTHTYLHTCVLCKLKSEAVTRSYRNLCFSFYEGEPNETHKKCEENGSPTAWASNVFWGGWR